MTRAPSYNPNITNDLIRLRDELSQKAFDSEGRTTNDELAVVVWKINSVLYKGYPRSIKRDPLIKITEA